MSLASRITALATRISTEVKAKYTKPSGGIPIGDLATSARVWHAVLIQTYGPQVSNSPGQMLLPYPVPANVKATGIRYWQYTNGSGGINTVELRKGGVAVGNAVAGSLFSPALAPSWNTVDIDFNAGDMLYVYQTSANTTPGTYLMAEILGYFR